MPKDDDPIIFPFLKKLKMDKEPFTRKETILAGSIQEMLTERRAGNMDKVKFWMKSFMDEVRAFEYYDDKSHKIIESATEAFVKKNGRFTYAAAFKKRAKELRGIMKISKSKGGGQARKDSQKLHKQMISNRELPKNTSYADFEKSLTQSFGSSISFDADDMADRPKEVDVTKLIKKMKWSDVKSKFGLDAKADTGLQKIATGLVSKGPSDKKIQTKAEELLAAHSKNKKAKPKELVTAVYKQVSEAVG